MTLGVGIEAVNGIVIASDSRATFGDLRGLTTVNDTAMKIFTPTNKTALALSGQGDTGNALMQNLAPALATLAAQPNADIDAVAEAIRNAGRQQYIQWFGNPAWLVNANGQPVCTPRPDIWFLLAGYTQSGQAKIINTTSSAPFNFAPGLSTTGFAAIGVAQLAMYLLNRLYRRGISLDVAKDLAAYCIEETASQDGKVGGPLRMAIVRPNQDTEIIGDEEIDELGRRVSAHRDALRNSFLTQGREPQPDLPAAPAEPELAPR